jgi:DNA-binding response OmpR family regulator
LKASARALSARLGANSDRERPRKNTKKNISKKVRKGLDKMKTAHAIALCGAERMTIMAKTDDMKLTESETALFEIFSRFKGRGICAEYLSERGLHAPMTDGGLEVRRRVNALREKLRGSGCTIRETEVEIADIDEPGTVYRSTDYVFDRKKPTGEASYTPDG